MLCINCRTGKELYKLDSSEPMCPYMQVYKDGICAYFKPCDGKEENKNKKD